MTSAPESRTADHDDFPRTAPFVHRLTRFRIPSANRCMALLLASFLGLAHSATAQKTASPKAEVEELCAVMHEALKEGQLQAARVLCEQVIKMEPAVAVHHYNLACIEARDGNTPAAIAALTNAVELGFHRADIMDEDTDLDGIRYHAAYRSLWERTAKNGADRRRATGGSAGTAAASLVPSGFPSLTDSFRLWLPHRQKQVVNKMVLDKDLDMMVPEASTRLAPYTTSKLGSRDYHFARCEIPGVCTIYLAFEATGDLPTADDAATEYLFDLRPAAAVINLFGSSDNSPQTIVIEGGEDSLSASDRLADQRIAPLLAHFGGERRWENVAEMPKHVYANGDLRAVLRRTDATAGEGNIINCASREACIVQSDYLDDFQ